MSETPTGSYDDKISKLLDSVAQKAKAPDVARVYPKPEKERIIQSRTIEELFSEDLAGLFLLDGDSKGKPLTEDALLELYGQNKVDVDVILERVKDFEPKTVEQAVDIFRDWLEKENNKFCSQWKSKRETGYNLIQKLSIKRAMGLSKYLEELSSHVEEGLFLEARHQLLLMAGALWSVDTDVLKDMGMRQSNVIGQATVSCAVTQEFLKEQPEDLDIPYQTNPVNFWSALPNPDVSEFNDARRNIMNGSLAEITTARGLQCLPSVRERGLKVVKSDPSEDVHKGYDFVLLDKFGQPILYIDIKSFDTTNTFYFFQGEPRIHTDNSRGHDLEKVYNKRQEYLDKLTIPDSLKRFAREGNKRCMVMRVKGNTVLGRGMLTGNDYCRIIRESESSVWTMGEEPDMIIFKIVNKLV